VWENLLLQKPANNILSLEVDLGVRRTAGRPSGPGTSITTVSKRFAKPNTKSTVSLHLHILQRVGILEN
jgi:hypothetical protein